MFNLKLTMTLPNFSSIHPEKIVSSVKALLEEYCNSVNDIVEHQGPFVWKNLCQPLAELDNRLSYLWSPINHLNAVKNNIELREAYEQCLPLLSEFNTWLGQNKKLYKAYINLKEGPTFADLNTAQRKFIENMLRDFKLSGIDLSPIQQERYGKISARLSELASTYSNNVLDATMGWSKLITDIKKLKGLPEKALTAARMMAEVKKKKGWLFTLDMPSYLQVLTYADNDELRKEIYSAFVTRASDKGPNACKWDNNAIMEEILSLRHELAQLLGFQSYADKSLATKMADNTQEVLCFLKNLIKLVRPQAEKELSQLRVFAKQQYAISELEAWDITYYAEKQKYYLFSINNEQLRQYFPIECVLEGIFKVIKLIYGIDTQERKDIDIWHPDVRFFDLFDVNGLLCGSFYLDIYARENKRNGAWMDSCINSFRLSNGEWQKPVAYLTCNFNGPVGDTPALLTHDEVVTLFHEFGHGLHHMLTKIDIYGVSGINGVPWDAVELPSQFMENWCWEPQVLEFISGHYQTKKSLPKEMITKLVAIRNYNVGLFILRQLELSLFDFCMHHEYDPMSGSKVLNIFNSVREKVSITPAQTWERFPNSFNHIFSGGYAAGYYSYLWSEVLSADAFSRFKEEGIFNSVTGKDFLENILSLGGSEEPMILFERFRGRKPQLDAMLRDYGIQF